MKLNVGCGTDIREEYINLDIRELPGVDIVCNMMDEEIPLPEESCDKILAKDILEHFPLDKTDMIITKWWELLKPRATLHIQVPNTLLNVLQWIKGETKTLKKTQHITERFSQLIYGKQDYPGNFHYQLFDESRLEMVLKKNGFGDMEFWTYGRALCVKAYKNE